MQNDWLRRHALQSQSGGMSRVYVIRDVDTDDEVVGYYALAAGCVKPADAPARLMKGAGLYDQPVVLLARLGVDHRVQGMGLGRALVADVMRRVVGVADQVGVRALMVHCESESARAFYLQLAEFEVSPTDPLHLVLPIKRIRRFGTPGG
ncbi:GNAT family N-acetyltransferase [Planomonospora sp. ID82291]|nr:GNAT family N-acetyltransferase [Planomonospora sp. ID82291]